MCQVLNSADCNKLNTVAMGPILRWMDIAACLSAEKLSLTCCVTLSMDHLLFDSSFPVECGATILVEAQVSHVAHTLRFSASLTVACR
jgi:acyl-CoA hydrolase